MDEVNDSTDLTNNSAFFQRMALDGMVFLSQTLKFYKPKKAIGVGHKVPKFWKVEPRQSSFFKGCEQLKNCDIFEISLVTSDEMIPLRLLIARKCGNGKKKLSNSSKMIVIAAVKNAIEGSIMQLPNNSETKKDCLTTFSGSFRVQIEDWELFASFFNQELEKNLQINGNEDEGVESLCGPESRIFFIFYYFGQDLPMKHENIDSGGIQFEKYNMSDFFNCIQTEYLETIVFHCAFDYNGGQQGIPVFKIEEFLKKTTFVRGSKLKTFSILLQPRFGNFQLQFVNSKVVALQAYLRGAEKLSENIYGVFTNFTLASTATKIFESRQVGLLTALKTKEKTREMLKKEFYILKEVPELTNRLEKEIQRPNLHRFEYVHATYRKETWQPLEDYLDNAFKECYKKHQALNWVQFLQVLPLNQVEDFVSKVFVPIRKKIEEQLKTIDLMTDGQTALVTQWTKEDFIELLIAEYLIGMLIFGQFNSEKRSHRLRQLLGLEENKQRFFFRESATENNNTGLVIHSIPLNMSSVLDETEIPLFLKDGKAEWLISSKHLALIDLQKAIQDINTPEKVHICLQKFIDYQMETKFGQKLSTLTDFLPNLSRKTKIEFLNPIIVATSILDGSSFFDKTFTKCLVDRLLREHDQVGLQHILVEFFKSLKRFSAFPVWQTKKFSRKTKKELRIAETSKELSSLYVLSPTNFVTEDIHVLSVILKLYCKQEEKRDLVPELLEKIGEVNFVDVISWLNSVITP